MTPACIYLGIFFVWFPSLVVVCEGELHSLIDATNTSAVSSFFHGLLTDHGRLAERERTEKSIPQLQPGFWGEPIFHRETAWQKPTASSSEYEDGLSVRDISAYSRFRGRFRVYAACVDETTCTGTVSHLRSNSSNVCCGGSCIAGSAACGGGTAGHRRNNADNSGPCVACRTMDGIGGRHHATKEHIICSFVAWCLFTAALLLMYNVVRRNILVRDMASQGGTASGTKAVELRTGVTALKQVLKFVGGSVRFSLSSRSR